MSGIVSRSFMFLIVPMIDELTNTGLYNSKKEPPNSHFDHPTKPLPLHLLHRSQTLFARLELIEVGKMVHSGEDETRKP